MQDGLAVSYYWSRAFLLNKAVLGLLLVCNLLGTIYGYAWYGQQLEYTVDNFPLWYVPFVPDSPTASLFFTLALLILLLERRSSSPYSPEPAASRISLLRGLIEALAVVTLFKYGIWAVAMIVAEAAKGGAVGWEGWMLMGSHFTMAVEGLLFARWFRFGWGALALAAGWMFWNDFMDYQRGVYPWLSDVLIPDLPRIELFTIGLSVVGTLIGGVFVISRTRSKRLR
ncbi:DUF1405 domain-containing protein [Paenibacillus athensensis]|uniref:DUF1405 domain-containing protein n=1 Tax=Paenibacillus athensensis TaxID=1967502 RepID=UPI001E3FEA9C|nr:DUF1405 domain-containing protein [Paenibacillus athensensis]